MKRSTKKSAGKAKVDAGYVGGSMDFTTWLFHSEPSWYVLAVEAPLDAVADEFARLHKAKSVIRDVKVASPKKPGPASLATPVVQVGGGWAVILRAIGFVTSELLDEYKQDAEELSRSLKARAIAFVGEDTSGASGYCLYKSGEMVEEAEWEWGSDECRFTSRLRKAPKRKSYDAEFADSVFGGLGIYLPVCFASEGAQPCIEAARGVAGKIERGHLVECADASGGSEAAHAEGLGEVKATTLFTAKGHKGMVLSVAISPDGKLAVSASLDKTLRIWDMATGESMRILKSDAGWSTSVAISPDGKLAISGSEDHTLRVWDLATGKNVRTLKGHKDYVSSVAISPDGKLAISGSRDGTLKVWDLTSWKCAETLNQAVVPPCVAISPDGKLAVSGSRDYTLSVCDIATGKNVRILKGHTDKVYSAYSAISMVNSVAISPDGKLVFSSSKNTLRVSNLSTGECIRTLEGHTGWVESVAIFPGGKLALSGSWDSTLRVWDMLSGACLGKFVVDGEVRSCAIAPDGRTIVAGDTVGRMYFLRLEGI